MSEDLEKTLQRFYEELSLIDEKTHPIGTKSWIHEVQLLQEIFADVREKFVTFKHANAIIPRSVYDNKEVVETLKDLFKCLLGEEVVVVPKQKLKELSDRYHCGTSKERFYVICGFLKELFKET